MKKIFLNFIFISILFSVLQGCSKNTPEPPVPTNNVVAEINTPAGEKGYIYIDGKYIERVAPAAVSLKKGKHVVGIALKDSWKYLRKEMDFQENTVLTFTGEDQPKPRVWKALWIGISAAEGGGCTTRFSKEELDAGYNYFQWSITEHFEKYAYGTMQWEVTRKDLDEPVKINSTNSGYVLEPEELTRHIDIKPGDYDCIFVFWREKFEECELAGNYLGLGWTQPMSSSMKTGYVTIKFDVGNGTIEDKLSYFGNNDPGMWIHEWLHTVGEVYYTSRGCVLPKQAGDGFRVHAAEIYNYKFPWLDWYRDFISARVKDPSYGYVGIGPEMLLKCSLREEAGNICNE